MRSEFLTAINQVCAERNLSQEVVIEAVEAALVSAYKRNFGSSENIRTKVDTVTGQVRVYSEREIVETVEDPKLQVSLEDAQQIREEASVGETVLTETTPQDFGRIAAQTAKQVILQRIREAERDVLYSTYIDREGELITGTVQSIDHQAVTINLGKAEASLPRSEQIPGEHLHQNQRVKGYVLEVNRTNRGPQIIVSRTHRNMLRRLLETEVPEIFNGTVEIKQIAREAGSRSKVAVIATQAGVDPVGSCVGMRGVRIQNIVNELNGEKIDVVEWSADLASFIGNALSPAKVMNVTLREETDGSKTASVIVPDRQLSLAIGKEGQNARLAAKLTGWRIDIKNATEAAEEALSVSLAPVAQAEPVLSAEDLLAKAEAILMSKPPTEDGFDDALALTEEEATALAESEAEPAAEAEMVAEVAEGEVAEVSETLEVEAESEPVEVEAVAGEETAEAELAEEVVYEDVEAEAEDADQVEYYEEETFIGETEDEETEDDDSKPAEQKKKKSRKRTLVFDENSGRLVAKKRRKPGRLRDWAELGGDEFDE